MALCYGLSFYYEENAHRMWLIPIGICLVSSLVLSLLSRNADSEIGRRDGYLIVSSTWIVYCLFGMLPFLTGGVTDRVAVAFFEAMSGFTTTGATALDNIDALPPLHSLLAQPNALDRRHGNYLFHPRAAPRPRCGRATALLCRKHRLEIGETPPPRVHHDPLAVEHLPDSDRRLRTHLLFVRYGPFRCCEPCVRHHRNGWIFHARCQHRLLQVSTHRIRSRGVYDA